MTHLRRKVGTSLRRAFQSSDKSIAVLHHKHAVQHEGTVSIDSVASAAFPRLNKLKPIDDVSPLVIDAHGKRVRMECGR
jgi:hypothetical protein